MDDMDFPAKTPPVGDEMYGLVRQLFPICRSITGDGVRETLGILRERLPIEIHEVRSGTQVFDWTIPKEWNIREAYIMDAGGRKVVDFRNSNLHVLNYSAPIRARVSNEELKKHLYSLPDRPDWGIGQVQSVVGPRVTVNFENAGKRLLNADVVTIELVEDEPH